VSPDGHDRAPSEQPEDLLPHQFGDRPQVEEPPRRRQSISSLLPALLIGVGALVGYQVLLIAVAAPLSGWAPLAMGAYGPPPENVEAVLMWVLALPYALTAYALARQLAGERPRSLAGAGLAVALWAAPFYYPPVLTPSRGLDSALGVAYHMAPAVWGGITGAILADAVSRRPRSSGFWVLWEAVAPVMAAFFLVVLVYDSPATRPVLGPALLVASLASGALAGLAGRGGSHGLVGAFGCSVIIVLQGSVCLGLAYGPVWETAAGHLLPIMPVLGGGLVALAYHAGAARARRANPFTGN
jgi:hypothetical protein